MAPQFRLTSAPFYSDPIELGLSSIQYFSEIPSTLLKRRSATGHHRGEASHFDPDTWRAQVKSLILEDVLHGGRSGRRLTYNAAFTMVYETELSERALRAFRRDPSGIFDRPETPSVYDVLGNTKIWLLIRDQKRSKRTVNASPVLRKAKPVLSPVLCPKHSLELDSIHLLASPASSTTSTVRSNLSDDGTAIGSAAPSPDCFAKFADPNIAKFTVVLPTATEEQEQATSYHSSSAYPSTSPLPLPRRRSKAVFFLDDDAPAYPSSSTSTSQQTLSLPRRRSKAVCFLDDDSSAHRSSTPASPLPLSLPLPRRRSKAIFFLNDSDSDSDEEEEDVAERQLSGSDMSIDSTEEPFEATQPPTTSSVPSTFLVEGEHLSTPKSQKVSEADSSSLWTKYFRTSKSTLSRIVEACHRHHRRPSQTTSKAVDALLQTVPQSSSATEDSTEKPGPYVLKRCAAMSRINIAGSPCRSAHLSRVL